MVTVAWVQGRTVDILVNLIGGKITDLGFNYTKRGEVADTYEMTPHSGGYYHLSATYFPNGQLNAFQSAGLTPTLTYNVDGEGRPWKITASAGQNPVTSTVYNTASQVTSVAYGSGDSDSFRFDPNTQLPLGYTINVGAKSQTATIIQNANHTMRQLSIADSIFSNQNQTCVFGYDEFLRLTSDKCGSVWGAVYAYDLFGNMAKSTIAGSPGTSFQPTYNISNHYATIPAGAPSYDSVGNLLNDSFHQYTWDIEGNPATIDSYSFTYDALNRRVEYGTGSSFTQYLYAPYDLTRNLGPAVAFASPQLRIPTPGGGQAILGPSGVTDYRRPNWQQSEPVDANTAQAALSDASYTPYGEHYDANGGEFPEEPEIHILQESKALLFSPSEELLSENDCEFIKRSGSEFAGFGIHKAGFNCLGDGDWGGGLRACRSFPFTQNRVRFFPASSPRTLADKLPVRASR